MKKMFAGAALVAAMASVCLARPAQAHPRRHGRTHLKEALAESYWSWVFNVPADHSPILNEGPFCHEAPFGHAYFLPGSIVGVDNERSCDIPFGKRLFIPVMSSIYVAFESDPPEDKTLEAMLDFSRCPDVTGTLSIDGFSFDVSRQTIETGIFDIPVESGGLLEDLLADYDATADGAVITGIHVLLPPLPRGEHILHWTAQSDYCGEYDDNGDLVEPLYRELTYTVNIQ